MKKYSKFIAVGMLLLFLIASLSSCTIHHRHRRHVKVTPSGKVPPGHAKKMTGSKSAKHYAPGHRK